MLFEHYRLTTLSEELNLDIYSLCSLIFHNNIPLLVKINHFVPKEVTEDEFKKVIKRRGSFKINKRLFEQLGGETLHSVKQEDDALTREIRDLMVFENHIDKIKSLISKRDSISLPSKDKRGDRHKLVHLKIHSAIFDAINDLKEQNMKLTIESITNFVDEFRHRWPALRDTPFGTSRATIKDQVSQLKKEGKIKI